MPAILVALVAVLLLLGSPASASSLYEATVIVTGMDLRSRPGGLTQALRQVLTKVSGDPAWLDDPRVASVPARSILASLAYLDRQSDIPKHDEQGSRDRPYFMTARFDAVGVADLLRRWGDRPWTDERPVLVTNISVITQSGDRLQIQADTDSDERHRGALLAAADRFGLELFVPASTEPIPPPSAAATLTGTLAWSPTDGRWAGFWHVKWRRVERNWEGQYDSFDQAYRDALAGACRLISGH